MELVKKVTENIGGYSKGDVQKPGAVGEERGKKND
jgi:hypothetical protein